MVRTHTKFFVLIALASVSLHMFADDQNSATRQAPTQPRCELPGMAGSFPSKICAIIRRLQEENEQLKYGPVPGERTPFNNMLVLEGPSGTGKTSIANVVAKLTDSHLVELYGADVPNSFVGGSKDTVNKNIERAIAEGAACNQRVIIFIDEADGFSSNDKSSAHAEYHAAYMALWRHMDKYKHDPRVFFIFATNRLDKLPAQFKNRVTSQTIHMTNPDDAQRKDLLNHFSKSNTQKELIEYCSNDFIADLIKETQNFSARNIEDLCIVALELAYGNKEPVTQKYLMYALQEMKIGVEKQNAPSEEELEKERTKKRENELDELQRKNLELQQKQYAMQEQMLEVQQGSANIQQKSYNYQRYGF